MRAALLAGMLVLPSIAAAKAGCPQGAYRVDRTRNADVQALVIDFQAGTIALPGLCPAVAAKGYGSAISDEEWSGRVRARWSECVAGITVLRADLDYRCVKLRGRFRLRGGKVARIRATRVPVCGDGIVQAPEECEPLGEPCCTSECRLMSACSSGACQTDADCAPVSVCEWVGDCALTSGTCRVRRPDECGPLVVCGCDRQTYANACEPWAKKVPIETYGDCASFCRIGVPGYECAAGTYCEVSGQFCHEKTTGRYGRCDFVIDPATCPTYGMPPICGCDGRTYTNDCFRRAAGVQWGLCPGQPP